MAFEELKLDTAAGSFSPIKRPHTTNIFSHTTTEFFTAIKNPRQKSQVGEGCCGWVSSLTGVQFPATFTNKMEPAERVKMEQRRNKNGTDTPRRQYDAAAEEEHVKSVVALLEQLGKSLPPPRRRWAADGAVALAFRCATLLPPSSAPHCW